MALPTILVDSTNGAASDAACSGAGPTTALTGTAGATDGAGTTVTLDALTDLSGVDTTGLHVIYLADTTAGHRRFAKITGKAGSGGATPTVTVAEAFTALLTTKSWAIGGVRVSIGSASSALLFDNNGSAGDAMPGWTVQMHSGHTETISATLTFQRAGDVTTGPITLRGAAGAATLPILTFSNNDVALLFNLFPQIAVVQDFELQNSNATKTASYAARGNASGFTSNVTLVGLKIANSTNKFWRGIGMFYASLWTIIGCEVGYCADWGIGHFSASAAAGAILVAWNVVHHCTGTGISLNGDQVMVDSNIVAFNGSHGISFASNLWTATRNTVHGNASDGMRISYVDRYDAQNVIANNLFTFNGGWAINFSSSPAATALVGPYLGNLFNANTSGKYSPSGLPSIGESTVDPSAGLASATKDYVGVTNGLTFTIAASVAQGLAYPSGGSVYVGTYSTTYDYGDIGASQRQAAAGSSIGAQIFGG